MAYVKSDAGEEVIISTHSEQQWRRRELELTEWVCRDKPKRRNKQVSLLGNIEIDSEWLEALTYFKKIGIQTEYSCAGVSLLDEPEDHSFYAYITFAGSNNRSEMFVRSAMKYMRHRLLVTYEPSVDRYDFSSFLIGHNRSFCLLMKNFARGYWNEGRGELV